MSSTDPSNRKTPKQIGWRRVAFPLAAIGLALLPFLLVEAVLRFLDVGSTNNQASAGFGLSRPLFELDEESETFTTAQSRLLFFGRQEFAREKPEGTFRIFGLGGSTLHGRPYENATSFLKWMELELDERDPSRDYESINCGGLSYASYRLTYLLEEVLHYDADLIVVATGHNEFLEDRTYADERDRPAWARWVADRGSGLRTATLARRLVHGSPNEMQDRNNPSGLDSEVKARLDSESGYASYHRDEAWRTEVIEEYDRSVRKLVATCRAARVPLILVNLGENLRDCPPIKSEHATGLDADAQQRWQQLFDQAGQVSPTDAVAALGLYREAEAIDDQHALLAFRMARCHDRLKQWTEATDYYRRAKQLDVCPLRMIEELHSTLKEIAEETQTPFVDADLSSDEWLGGESPSMPLGNGHYMDHVHPSIGYHQWIGRRLVVEAEARKLVSLRTREDDWPFWQTYRNHFRRLGPAYLANGRRRVGWLEDWARRDRLDQEAMPIDQEAVPIDPDGHWRLGKKLLDFGEIEAAWQEVLPAMVGDPKLTEDVIAWSLTLFLQGRPETSRELLTRLHREPAAAAYRASIKLAYMLCAFDCGDTETAVLLFSQYYEEIDRAARLHRFFQLDPLPPPEESERAARAELFTAWLAHLPDAYGRISQIASKQGETPSAHDPFAIHVPSDGTDPTEVMQRVNKEIAANPQNDAIYVTRARMHFARRDYSAALIDVSRAIELAPKNVEAYKFRAILQMIRSDLEAAVADLTRGAELHPNDPEFLRMRAAVYRRLGNDAKADADLRLAGELNPPGD